MATESSQRPRVQAQVIALAVSILACFAAAGVGAVASVNSPEFYRQLNRPPFAPPAGVFGPVWTVLYLMQAVAAWLVWRETADRRRGTALALFAVQLVLNALWTWLFFAWRRGAWSFAEIVLLDVVLLATLVVFWRIRPAAGALLIPYLAWVSFATALTWSIWQRNPQWLG